MRTLGIDLAARPATTAACVIRWSPSGVEIERLDLGADDDELGSPFHHVVISEYVTTGLRIEARRTSRAVGGAEPVQIHRVFSPDAAVALTDRLLEMREPEPRCGPHPEIPG